MTQLELPRKIQTQLASDEYEHSLCKYDPRSIHKGIQHLRENLLKYNHFQGILNYDINQ